MLIADRNEAKHSLVKNKSILWNLIIRYTKFRKKEKKESILMSSNDQKRSIGLLSTIMIMKPTKLLLGIT